MSPQIPLSHSTAELRLIEELLALRDAEAEEEALRDQLAACVHWQKSLRRWLSLSRREDAHWHGVNLSDARDLLAALEEEEENIRQALHDVLGRPRRALERDEEALVNRFSLYERAEPPPPAEPDLAEPGSPEKVQLMSDRLDATRGLWHPLDPELEPTARIAYTPQIQATTGADGRRKGNFATIGRMVFILLMCAPEKQQ